MSYVQFSTSTCHHGIRYPVDSDPFCATETCCMATTTLCRHQSHRSCLLVCEAGASLLCRGCAPGEQYDDNVCRECQKQTYSFHPGDNGGQCQTCPNTARCPGGPIFVLDDNYWHSAFDTDTAQRCPNTFACRFVSAATPLHQHCRSQPLSLRSLPQQPQHAIVHSCHIM